MKKILLFALAAVVAAVTLCSASAGMSDVTSSGTVRFESTSVPALDFSMSISRAAEIFRLMPDSFTSLCSKEYEAVRSRCERYQRFTHEGVTIQRTGSDPALTIEFSASGYKLTVSDVSWEELDRMFLGNGSAE